MSEQQATPTQTSALVATELSYRRAQRTIVDRVSLTARFGEVLAVTGPSGSGKSSLLALLAGLEAADSGTVTRNSPPGRIGLILQAYGLVGLLTAAENVEIVLQAQPAPRRVSRAEIASRAAAALAEVALEQFADHLVEELSGGQQQRVAIARALVINPQILLGDEITAELDHASKDRVLESIFTLAARGAAVVLATHDPEIAERCDHVLHLIDGRGYPER